MAGPTLTEYGRNAKPRTNGRRAPLDEEAHFRIDEHEREIQGIKRAHGEIPAMVRGGVEALHASFESQIGKLIASQKEDVDTDREVVEKLEDLTERIAELCADIKALVKVLQAPTTRTATLQLPSGPASMTVKESRS
jgi:uncharacterized protein (DUF342 family)